MILITKINNLEIVYLLEDLNNFENFEDFNNKNQPFGRLVPFRRF